MGIKDSLKKNERLKKTIHYMLIPKNQARPRLWVKWFINPFMHSRGKGVTICSKTRMDVLPFNHFKIDDFSTIEDFATVNNGVGDVTIGKNTRIGIGNVIIGPVSIGNDVILAQNIVISGLNHQYENIDLPIHCQPITTKPIIIEDECWVGANAVITSGITIGKHSVIAAGAIVVKDIPPYSIAVGNPARVVKKYDGISKKWIKVNA